MWLSRLASFAVIQLFRILLIVAAAYLLMAIGKFEAAGAPALLASLLLFPLVLTARPALRLGRRLRLWRADGIITDDSRAPILYLRPFTVDTRTAEDDGLAEEIDPTQNLQLALVALLFGIDALTYEEELARAFESVGPLVAIGRPGERLPTEGAARMYVGHDRWKVDVEELISKARAIVLRPGSSTGLRWEFETVLKRADPRRVLVVLPNAATRRAAFKMAVAEMNGLVPVPLNVAALGQPSSFVVFDEQWRPSAVWLRNLNVRRSLKPFIDRLSSLDGPPPTVPTSRLVKRRRALRVLDAGLVAAMLIVLPRYIWSSHDDKILRSRIQKELCPKVPAILDTLADDAIRDLSVSYVDSLIVITGELDADYDGVRCHTLDDSSVVFSLKRWVHRAMERNFPTIVSRVAAGDVRQSDLVGILTLIGAASDTAKWNAAVDWVRISSELKRDTAAVPAATPR